MKIIKTLEYKKASRGPWFDSFECGSCRKNKNISELNDEIQKALELDICEECAINIDDQSLLEMKPLDFQMEHMHRHRLSPRRPNKP